MQRPLSPHLQVYKPQITSLMSILHRASGVFSAVGLVFISMLFISAPYGAPVFNQMAALVFSVPGKIIMLLFSVGVLYHLCNGIRHLVWDTGRGLTIPVITKSAYVVLVGTVVLILLLVF